MTGYVPAWAAFLIGFLVFLFVGVPLGAWVGWGYGAEHEEKRAEEEAAADAAAAAVRAWRPPPERAQGWLYTSDRTRYQPQPEARQRAIEELAVWLAPEVAHEAWTAHVEQAQAVANDQPDTRSDEEWMAEEFAKLNAFTDALLN